MSHPRRRRVPSRRGRPGNGGAVDAVLVWLLVGLLVGGVAGRVLRGAASVGRFGAAAGGALGGLLGGWALASLGVGSDRNWLGALAAAVAGTAAACYALRALDERRRG